MPPTSSMSCNSQVCHQGMHNFMLIIKNYLDMCVQVNPSSHVDKYWEWLNMYQMHPQLVQPQKWREEEEEEIPEQRNQITSLCCSAALHCDLQAQSRAKWVWKREESLLCPCILHPILKDCRSCNLLNWKKTTS